MVSVVPATLLFFCDLASSPLKQLVSKGSRPEGAGLLCRLLCPAFPPPQAASPLEFSKSAVCLGSMPAAMAAHILRTPTASQLCSASPPLACSASRRPQPRLLGRQAMTTWWQRSPLLPLPPLPAAATSSSGAAEAGHSSSSSSSNNHTPHEGAITTTPSSSSNSGSGPSSSPEAVPMRSLLGPGSSGGDPSSRRRQQPEQRQGERRGRMAGERLRRTLGLLGLLRSPVTLRRFGSIGFMFVVGSLLSLASSRGRCAGPQEVSGVLLEPGNASRLAGQCQHAQLACAHVLLQCSWSWWSSSAASRGCCPLLRSF